MTKPTSSEAEQIDRLKTALQIVGDSLDPNADDWRERLVEARECMLVALDAIGQLLPSESRCNCPGPCVKHPTSYPAPRNQHDKDRW